MTIITIYNSDIVNGSVPVEKLEGATELDFRDCNNLTAIPQLPNSLEKIIFSNCPTLESIGSLENLGNLKEIIIYYCDVLKSISSLPVGLKELYITSCSILETLPTLPNDLKKLNLNNCDRLGTITSLPSGLEELAIDGNKSGSLQTLPDVLKKLVLYGNNPEILTALPNGLKKLNLTVTNIEALPVLPRDLEYLNLAGSSNLETLPVLPEGLKELDLSLTNIKTLSVLATSLEKLYLSMSINLKTLTALPNCLKELNLSECYNLETLPVLPDHLQKLNLRECTNLKTLPTLPSGLKELNLFLCSNLTTLPTLPDNLEKLNLSACSNLKSLPTLPRHLEELDLRGCANLETLPVLPDHLQKLDLRECPRFQPTLELLEKLSASEGKGCYVSYPRHFSHNSVAGNAIKRLYDLITKYTENQENERIDSSFITYLFHRYLTEGISQRIAKGNLTQKARIIAQSTQPFLDFIEKNPNSLSWIGDVCVDHKDGCVNQPVFAFAKINALIEIAKQEALIDKINNSKYLITLDSIIAKVSQNSPGASVEVEAVNMVLIDLHKELLARNLISTPWEGVPEKIAYESTVKNWFDSFKSRRGTDELMQSFQDLDTKRCGEILCDVYHEKWYKIAFSDDPEIKRFKEEYVLANESGEYNEIQQLIHLKNQKDEKIINRTKALTQNAVEIQMASSLQEIQMERPSLEIQTNRLSQTLSSLQEIRTVNSLHTEIQVERSAPESLIPRSEGVRVAQSCPILVRGNCTIS